MPVIIREFRHDDIADLLGMMRDLANFEGYLDDFRVGAKDLENFGLTKNPSFQAHVAQTPTGELAGMAVTYIVPWTYDMQTTLVMKELYVKPQWRSKNIGEQLLQAVFRYGDNIGASRIQWTVLKTNSRAIKFYQRNGGAHDQIWDLWGRA